MHENTIQILSHCNVHNSLNFLLFSVIYNILNIYLFIYFAFMVAFRSLKYNTSPPFISIFTQEIILRFFSRKKNLKTKLEKKNIILHRSNVITNCIEKGGFMPLRRLQQVRTHFAGIVCSYNIIYQLLEKVERDKK